MAFDERLMKRDPRAVRAVHPRATNQLDIAEWERQAMASEHIPMGSQKPVVEGKQLQSQMKPGRKRQDEIDLQLSLPQVRAKRGQGFGQGQRQPAPSGL